MLYPINIKHVIINNTLTNVLSQTNVRIPNPNFTMPIKMTNIANKLSNVNTSSILGQIHPHYMIE